MDIITTDTGRALAHGDLQADLPALGFDTVIHVWETPAGLWLGRQDPGQPRDVYPGAGGTYLGKIDLEAEATLAAREALSRAAERALKRINAGYESEVGPLVASYPEIERASWTLQQDEARAYNVWVEGGGEGEAPDTPVLDQILAGRNSDGSTETLAELSVKVIRNADNFIAVQRLTGRRHMLERRIDTANANGDLEGLEAIVW